MQNPLGSLGMVFRSFEVEAKIIYGVALIIYGCFTLRLNMLALVDFDRI